MSKEWLAQLSATAAKQSRRPVRSQAQAQPRPQPSAPPVARRPEGSQRSFLGAIIGSIIRWGIISAAAGAIFVFVVAEQEYLEDSIGERVLYGIWYLATLLAGALPEEAARTVDANAIYEALKPHAGLLPFVAPLATGAAITLLFLPTVNAYRRRFGLRFFVFLFNLAILYWILQMGWIKFDLTGKDAWLQTFSLKAVIPWAILLVFSFAGIRRGRSSVMLPTPVPSRTGTSAPGRPMPDRAPASPMAGRSVQVIAGREAGSAVQRSVSGGSWRRPR